MCTVDFGTFNFAMLHHTFRVDYFTDNFAFPTRFVFGEKQNCTTV